MVLSKLPVPERPTIWITVGQVRVGVVYSPLSPSLWETARYRLKYCLKGPLNPKQPTNQLTSYTQGRQMFLCQNSRLVGW